MSEVLALAVEALVPLRHKAVNGCLVKFPELRCEPFPHVLLDVVRGESFAPQRLFFRGPKWRKRRERSWLHGVWSRTSHLNFCKTHLQRYAREGNDFLVSGDESWCHHFEPESKRQSFQWNHPGPTSPKNPRPSTQVQERLCWRSSLIKTAPFW